MNKKKLEINISKINNPMFPLFSTPSYKKVFSKENSIDKPISGGTKKIVFGQTIGGYGQGQAQQGQGLQQPVKPAGLANLRAGCLFPSPGRGFAGSAHNCSAHAAVPVIAMLP